MTAPLKETIRKNYIECIEARVLREKHKAIEKWGKRSDYEAMLALHVKDTDNGETNRIKHAFKGMDACENSSSADEGATAFLNLFDPSINADYKENKA